MAPFKVAIVGGGMTGLTAALHLDRLGIDFVLLEAYDDITPEVGASLALYPNFQRVLNHLGVLDDVRRKTVRPNTMLGRDASGKVMFEHQVAARIRAATGGYSIATFTRSALLRMLYGHISEEGKSKMRTGQRVARIEQLPGDEGVRLHTETGETLDVDVVIGADGTRSTVRSEMWRLAQEADSKAFKGDQGEDAQTEFAAVFGLSNKTGDLKPDNFYQVLAQDMTIGLFSNAEGHGCWFLFFEVDNGRAAKRGLADVPRWTDEEGAEICNKYAGAKLTDNTTFGDVYANRYRITTQPCPHHCLRKWHWGRMICLGDSVAKTNPILAQGGAQGAESVMMLIDRLHAALQQQQGQKLTTPQIEGILSAVNAERMPRVRAFVEQSQQLIRISSFTGLVNKIVGKYILPLLPTWILVSQVLGPWRGAYVPSSLPAGDDPWVMFAGDVGQEGKHEEELKTAMV